MTCGSLVHVGRFERGTLADVFDRERRSSRSYGNASVGWVRLAPLAKAQILSQASTAMLSQANQSQQGVLKLLQ